MTSKEVSYTKSKRYWSKLDSSLTSMLGGYERVDSVDIRDSKAFIKLLDLRFKRRAVDCGAGIGRVSKHLLLPEFESVDLVEVVQKFLDDSSEFIGASDNQRIEKKFCIGLQDFSPITNHYDVIWIQWVCGYLKDTDFVAFLKRCATALSADNPSSAIVIKDNLVVVGNRVHDDEDSSFTRTKDEFFKCFEEANLEVVQELLQSDWIPELFPVYMFALRPK